MKINLPEKEQKILDFINKQISEKGYPPSVREICRAVGFKSTSTVHGYLKNLEEKGLIFKDPSKPRALKVLNENVIDPYFSEKSYSMPELIEVPIVGQVTAGQPILAVENIEGTFPLPVEIARNGIVFALRVKGESMINAGILDGDLAIVRQQQTAENGDIVVALIDDEATVKTFYKEKHHFRLQPENDFMEPIIVKEVLILGKVVGIFREIR